jgi:DNA-binding beta-propeller fold protein YncE
MRRSTQLFSGLFCLGLAGLAQPAQSRVLFEVDPFIEPQVGFANAGPFTMTDPPLGKPGHPGTPPGSHGSRILAWQGGTLVLDADSGELVQTDSSGEVKARRSIGVGATQMVIDRKQRRLYAVDRAGDRVRVVDLSKPGLPVVGNLHTHAEPFGVALDPRGETLLVTTVADHSLTAYDPWSGDSKWDVELGPEPRGVAVSPDGTQAMVSFLSTGAVARVQLHRSRPSVSYVALDPPKQTDANQFFRAPMQQQAMHVQTKSAAVAANGKPAPKVVDPDPERIGRRHARNAFAVAYVGHGLAVVPHQVSMPHAPNNGVENMGSYGGGFMPPIAHRISFVDAEGGSKVAGAEIDLHQPRALAYSAATDTLFVVGYGSDTLSAFAEISQPSVHLAFQTPLGGSAACGPEGVAVSEDHAKVHVFCTLSRKVATIEVDAPAKGLEWSEPVAQSRLSSPAQVGRELFRRGRDHRLSQAGALACASCHPEGRTDGLSWRIEGNTLQTPLLAGRLVGSHPFKWDGKDANLSTSLRNTVRRLGGGGITNADSQALQAFLTSLPAVRTPTPDDARAVARGRKLFFGTETGCADCHSGDNYSDGNQYDHLAPELGEVDTPSLKGLAFSAPYYHDGSARTLEALLMGNGSVHGMGGTSHLSEREIDDLVAFLETL